MFFVQRLHLTSEDWHKVHYSYAYIYDKLVLFSSFLKLCSFSPYCELLDGNKQLTAISEVL